jgi:hypothetical protein
MIFTPHYITTSTCKPAPPLTHQATLLIQIHILASLIKFKLENSESQVYLQGKARVNPAPATLAVNGHGFTVKFLWIIHTSIHYNQYLQASPPLTHQATS